MAKATVLCHAVRMSVFDASESNGEFLTTTLVAVGTYATSADAAAHGLVILALGQPYWLEESAAGFRVLVEPSTARPAKAHLDAYDRESVRWPPAPLVDPWRPNPANLITPLLWSLTMLALFRFTSPAWLERGAVNAREIFVSGEWWRVVTALFLHADAAHVLSNTLAGLLVFFAVISTFGVFRGWLMLLAAAGAGNLMIAAAHFTAAYSSVGASTAVFAGIGLLSGRAGRVAWTSSHPHRARLMFAPFATGAIMLALYGAGASRVDVGAHLAGFVSGLALGFVLGLGPVALRKFYAARARSSTPQNEG
jgi:rhomboid protease GluP